MTSGTAESTERKRASLSRRPRSVCRCRADSILARNTSTTTVTTNTAESNVSAAGVVHGPPSAWEMLGDPPGDPSADSKTARWASAPTSAVARR